jgi:hypothetical protein
MVRLAAVPLGMTTSNVLLVTRGTANLAEDKKVGHGMTKHKK